MLLSSLSRESASSAVVGKPRFLRGPSGLGDSVYLRPIAEYLARHDQRPLVVLSNYPDIFSGSGLEVHPFRRLKGLDYVAHYVHGKDNRETTQFEDMCVAARISEPVPFRFTSWRCSNPALVERLRKEASGRPIVLVHGGCVPMGRTDGFGAELLPKRGAFVEALSALNESAFTVRVGKSLGYPLEVSCDLQGRTTILELVDLFCAADGVLGQCSYAVPLAEVFARPLVCVWSASGLRARSGYVRSITPKKIFHLRSSRFVQDDWAPEKIREVVGALRDLR